MMQTWADSSTAIRCSVNTWFVVVLGVLLGAFHGVAVGTVAMSYGVNDIKSGA